MRIPYVQYRSGHPHFCFAARSHSDATPEEDSPDPAQVQGFADRIEQLQGQARGGWQVLEGLSSALRGEYRLKRSKTCGTTLMP